MKVENTDSKKGDMRKIKRKGNRHSVEIVPVPKPLEPQTSNSKPIDISLSKI
ncbi:conserved hypothetical protein [Ricinus communis]|uniref:Uncharacterized protein n=1 Tax=Ricinus communis TaxID=3988 RepID=B9SN11_RICCO|nr:conserved hypothetical protein [Ricinus communis]